MWRTDEHTITASTALAQRCAGKKKVASVKHKPTVVVKEYFDEWPNRMSCRHWGLNDRLCCVHHSRDSQFFLNGPYNPQNCPFIYVGRSRPHVHNSLGPPQSLTPKRHLDRFSCLALHICVTNTQTDRQTDRQTCDIRSNRPHLMHNGHAMSPKTTCK